MRCAWAVAWCLTLAACGGGVELSLQLRPGVDDVTGARFDTTSINALHIVLISGGKTDEHTVAFDATKQIPVEPTIDKSKPVRLDVWGCAGSACERQGDVAFRGCTPEELDLSQRDGTIPVVIEMFPLGDAHIANCPSF